MKSIAKIESQRRISSAKAKLIFFKPKKIALHKTLRIRLMPKTTASLIFNFLLFEDSHAKYKDRAIRKNKMFQTIGKIKLGGVNSGLMA